MNLAELDLFCVLKAYSDAGFPVLRPVWDARRANLLWGVVPIRVDPREFKDRPGLARRVIRAFDPGHDGDHILLVRGFRSTIEKSTPSVTVLTI